MLRLLTESEVRLQFVTHRYIIMLKGCISHMVEWISGTVPCFCPELHYPGRSASNTLANNTLANVWFRQPLRWFRTSVNVWLLILPPPRAASWDTPPINFLSRALTFESWPVTSSDCLHAKQSEYLQPGLPGDVIHSKGYVIDRVHAYARVLSLNMHAYFCWSSTHTPSLVWQLSRWCPDLVPGTSKWPPQGRALQSHSPVHYR